MRGLFAGRLALALAVVLDLVAIHHLQKLFAKQGVILMPLTF